MIALEYINAVKPAGAEGLAWINARGAEGWGLVQVIERWGEVDSRWYWVVFMERESEEGAGDGADRQAAEDTADCPDCHDPVVT